MNWALTPDDLAEWLWEVSLTCDSDLTLDIGPDHTLLVLDEQGNVVAERSVVAP